MKVPIWIIPALTIALLFGSWGIGKAVGQWETSGRQQVVPGEQITVADIKGWMTIQQVADGLGLEPQEIITLLDAPDGVEIGPQTQFKELEELIPGFGLTTFRPVLTAYLTGSAPPAAATSSSSQTSAPAAPDPTPTGTPTGTGTPGAGSGTPTGTGTPGSGSTAEITGQMTLRQVADDYGLDVAVLAAEAGLPADTDPDLALKQIRDTVAGFEIQAVRDAVARLTSGG